jgi:hypothetical protein
MAAPQLPVRACRLGTPSSAVSILNHAFRAGGLQFSGDYVGRVAGVDFDCLVRSVRFAQ